jgi:hypothetical protein
MMRISCEGGPLGVLGTGFRAAGLEAAAWVDGRDVFDEGMVRKCKGRCARPTRSDLDTEGKQRRFKPGRWTPVAHKQARRKKTSITLVFFNKVRDSA